MTLFRWFSFFLALCPAIYLCVGWWYDLLSANVIEDLIHISGHWTLFFLFLTLFVAPLTRYIPIVEIRGMRRQWGLFCFFYALIHLSVYIGLEFYFDWTEIYYDVIDNKYIIVGMFAFCLLLFLAITSTRSWRRRLKKFWQRLHKAVYVIFILSSLHFLWLTKADYTEPVLYSTLISVLLIERFWHFYSVKCQS